MTDHLLPQEQSTLKVLLRERLDSLLKEIREDLLKSDDHRDAMLSDRVRDVGDESLADLIVDLDLADLAAVARRCIDGDGIEHP